MTIAKRWRDREQRWVAPGELFDQKRFAVDVVHTTPAKAFVVNNHYHGSFPPDQLNVGLFGPGAALVGVATFSVPMPAVLNRHTGELARQACELGRFVCLPEVAYNGETWMLARAFRLLLEEKGFTAVVSFADPMEWKDGSIVIKPAHYGTIYQASNALYLGLATPRTLWIAPNGRRLNGRGLQKLRAGEKGHAYFARQLLDAGCPRRETGESPRDWLRRLRRIGVLRTERHHGNHTYVFGLTDASMRSLELQHPNRPAYPKRRIAA